MVFFGGTVPLMKEGLVGFAETSIDQSYFDFLLGFFLIQSLVFKFSEKFEKKWNSFIDKI